MKALPNGASYGVVGTIAAILLAAIVWPKVGALIGLGCLVFLTLATLAAAGPRAT